MTLIYAIIIFSEPGVIKGFLLIISQFGFIVFDISYASVVINYAMQCQIIIYSLDNICTRMLNRYWTTVDETITVLVKHFFNHYNLSCRKLM